MNNRFLAIQVWHIFAWWCILLGLPLWWVFWANVPVRFIITHAASSAGVEGPKAWTNLNWPGSEYQRLSPLPDVASLSLHSWAWAFASPMRKNWTRLQHGLKIGVRLCESRKIRAGSVFRPRGNYCRYIEIASTPPFSWKWGTTKCLWFIIIFPSTIHHFRGVQTIFRCTRMVKPCWILMTSQSDSGPFFLSAKKGSWYFGVFLHSCLMVEWWLNGG